MSDQEKVPKDQIEWSDQDGSRGRAAWLLLVKPRSNEIFRFIGKSIPGIVAIRGTSYEKNGKWSHTTYRLTLGPEVVQIPGRQGWETGTFLEGLGSALKINQPDSWDELASALMISRPVAEKFLREWKPGAASALDKAQADLDALSSTSLPTPMIVTRHASLVKYLAEIGITGEVFPHVTADQVKDRDVIGFLPFSLAAVAKSVTEIPLALTPEDRGVELTLARIREIAGKPTKYVVNVVNRQDTQ